MGIPVSILVCTRNRAERLGRTLNAMGRLEVPEGLEPELVVVDNGSTDGTAAVVEALRLPNMPARLVHEPRKGVAFARNAALAAARGEVLLFTDDDMLLPQNWITGLCRPILTGKADAVAGKIVLAPHLVRPWMSGFHRAALASTEAIDEDDPSALFCGSMSFSRRVLDRVEGFDTELGPGTECGALDDTLFAWQIRQAGFKIVTAFDVVAEHHFEEDHLLRAAFLHDAEKRAYSMTYIRYHWMHLPEKAWTNRTAAWQLWRSPRFLIALRVLRLALWRGTHWKQWRRPEGMSHREFGLLMSIHRLTQFLKERKRPRNYDALGLAKRTGAGVTG
jgi:glycosyltransferase involved in cell wall biosynthesis